MFKICASCYVVDFEKKELLMVYNKKLEKWLQPGGHMEVEDKYLTNTAIREVKEETGIEIELIGLKFQDTIEPIAVESYNTKIGPQIDVQYVGITKDKTIIDNEHNQAKWLTLEEMTHVDQEIKEKFIFILNTFDKFDETIVYNYQKVIKL